MIFYKVLANIIISLSLLLTPFTQIKRDPNKGLAMAYPNQEDLSRLGKDIWFYDWGSRAYDNPNYVPMSWCGEDPNLPLDYSGYLLLFNEPEVETQCNITPQEGIDHYLILKDKYPDARFIVGNTTFWGGWQYWLNFFWDLCNANQACIMPEYWGVHVYISGDPSWVPYVKTELTHLHNKIGGVFWITEFAEIGGDVKTDSALMSLFATTPWIARWAYFTNRSAPDAPWVLDGWKVDLFDWNTGEITDIGKWYIGNSYITMLPIVMKKE